MGLTLERMLTPVPSRSVCRGCDAVRAIKGSTKGVSGAAPIFPWRCKGILRRNPADDDVLEGPSGFVTQRFGELGELDHLVSAGGANVDGDDANFHFMLLLSRYLVISLSMRDALCWSAVNAKYLGSFSILLLTNHDCVFGRSMLPKFRLVGLPSSELTSTLEGLL